MSSKYIRISLGSPYLQWGLFNQIWGLCLGILAGHSSSKHIVVPYFYLQYNLHDYVKISKIIDLKSLNKHLHNIGIKINIFSSHGHQIWKQTHLLSDSYRYIDIGPTFRLPNDDERDLVYKILSGLEFKSEFTSIVNWCLHQLNLTNFIGIHLRLEDDMIIHLSSSSQTDIIATEYTNKYLKFIDDHVSLDQHIYLATHLGRSPNRCNHVLDLICKKYKNTKIGINWRSHFPAMYSGREIDAIVDFLICRRSKIFLGYSCSTFSATLYQLSKLEGKPAFFLP